jgi:hypothetical protein
MSTPIQSIIEATSKHCLQELNQIEIELLQTAIAQTNVNDHEQAGKIQN